jgi:hypothetical protein
VANVASGPAAKVSIFVPELKRLYVASSAKGAEPAKSFDLQCQIGAFRNGVTDLLIIGLPTYLRARVPAHGESPRGIVGVGVRPIRKMKRETNMQNSSGIRDKVVAITGASSGIV